MHDTDSTTLPFAFLSLIRVMAASSAEGKEDSYSPRDPELDAALAGLQQNHDYATLQNVISACIQAQGRLPQSQQVSLMHLHKFAQVYQLKSRTLLTSPFSCAWSRAFQIFGQSHGP